MIIFNAPGLVSLMRNAIHEPASAVLTLRPRGFFAPGAAIFLPPTST